MVAADRHRRCIAIDREIHWTVLLLKGVNFPRAVAGEAEAEEEEADRPLRCALAPPVHDLSTLVGIRKDVSGGRIRHQDGQ